MHIINIVHFPIDYSLDRSIAPAIEWKQSDDRKVAIWEGNYSQILGNEVLKYDQSNIIYEVWRPDKNADRIYTHTFSNGLIYRLFPSVKIPYQMGLKKHWLYFSRIMFDEIDELRSKDPGLILHINAAFRRHDYLILRKFHNVVPIVGQFYTNPEITFGRIIDPNPVKMIHRILIRRTLNKFYSENTNLIPSQMNPMAVFERKYGTKVFSRYTLSNYGIDFSYWTNDVPKHQARERLGINKNAFVFFCSSRLVPEKQIDKMLREFAKIRSENFLIYLSGNGSSEYTKLLNDLVEKLGINDKVTFIGFVPTESIKLFYCASDVFISSSKSEGGPLSTALAALYELPIITTRTGLVYELISQNGGGIYIDKDDPSKWHKTFLKALDPSTIPVCPKQVILDYFNWEPIAKYYIDVYRSVLEDFHKQVAH